ncbi:hypothetical protein CEXT_192911 [Caerostris extrusa]|uniref:Uncharacterized protein n=1 Tax=Caerostris extrusa TaxID=172846 RepID=A0AAV4R4S0_CAEEX|nr:hypothetical protein CEXT_192911 [Caerostris extrusa]
MGSSMWNRFHKWKKEIGTDKTLTPYEPTLSIICDASPWLPNFKLATYDRLPRRIFHPSTKLSPMTSDHLLRHATFLAAFGYEVIFKKGIENVDANCLSRVPMVQTDSTDGMIINK